MQNFKPTPLDRHRILPAKMELKDSSSERHNKQKLNPTSSDGAAETRYQGNAAPVPSTTLKLVSLKSLLIRGTRLACRGRAYISAWPLSNGRSDQFIIFLWIIFPPTFYLRGDYSSVISCFCPSIYYRG